MKILLVLILLVLVSGCTTLDQQPGIHLITSQQAPDGRLFLLFENRDVQCALPNCFKDSCREDWQSHTPENHEFGVLLPKGKTMNQLESAPVFLWLRGGGSGWIDKDGLYADSEWRTENYPYFGSIERNQKVMRTYIERMAAREHAAYQKSHGVTSPSLFSRIREQKEDWILVFPSYCTHDSYSGERLAPDGTTRNGWPAVVQAIQKVNAAVGIEYLIVAGSSAGGAGTYKVARDLEPTTGIPVLGGVIDSNPIGGDRIFEYYVNSYEQGGNDLWVPEENKMYENVVCPSNFQPFEGTMTYWPGERLDPEKDYLAGAMNTPTYWTYSKRDYVVCYDAEADVFHDIRVALEAAGDMNVMRESCLDPIDTRSNIPNRCRKHGTVLVSDGPGSLNKDAGIDVEFFTEWNDPERDVGPEQYVDNQNLVEDIMEWIDDLLP